MSIQPTALGDVNRTAGQAPGRGPTSRTVPRRTLVDEVHDKLVVLLLETELEPGSPLRIDHLARDWGVSQTPVREALSRAAASGLVVRLPLRGYQVAPLVTEEQFDQLMEVRLLLEPRGAARACERGGADLADELERIHARMAAAPRGPHPRDVREYLRADVDFHQEIVRASQNGFLEAALAATAAHAHRFRRFPGGVVSDAEDALAEHEAVLEAVRRGDAEAAAESMRHHLEGVARRARTEPAEGRNTSQRTPGGRSVR